MQSTRKYTYISDITATRESDTHLSIEPLRISLPYTVISEEDGSEYAEFPTIKTDLFDRDDISLSQQERYELEDYLDSVAREVE